MEMQVRRLAAEKPVVIFGKSYCTMFQATRALFFKLGVTAAVYELDRHPKGPEFEIGIARIEGTGRPPAKLPAVFIGGELKGSTTEIMNLHICGQLIPLLRKEGALFGTF